MTPPQTLSAPFVVPTWRNALFLLAALLGVLAAVDAAVPSNPLRIWYYMRVVGPAQEARYGFKAKLDDTYYCLEVVSVVPGGAFEKAGIRPGYEPYMPSCLGIHVAANFFSVLDVARGDSVRIRFVPDGCRQHASRWIEPVSVVIQAPKPAV